ncbi:MAG TPA: SIMPL domain-containing protein [Clostridia bacterium]|nr:SIMPL domain-containing protein [Clostridia bacterium]
MRIINKRVDLCLLLGILTIAVLGCKSPEEIDKSVKEQKPAQEIIIKQELERDERILAVMGNGELEVAPDLLWAEFAVETLAGTANEAHEQNSLKISAVIDAIQSIGVAREDIKITETVILPKNGNDKSLAQTSEYAASNTIVVKTEKVEKAGGLVSEAVKAGAEKLLRFEFALLDAKKPYQEAITLAVTDAYEKAHIMSLASDFDLLGPLSIKEISEHPSMLSYPVLPNEQESTINNAPVQSGRILVTAQVSIEFRLKWPAASRS